MDDATVEEFVTLAGAAAKAGGSAALAELAVGLTISTKTIGLDVVTNVDLASQQAIWEVIHTARPDDGFLGEEGESHSGSSGVTWVVDPVDGTANLVKGLPFWSVSVAARSNDQTIAGAVHNPVIGELFSGGFGCGLFLNGQSFAPARIDVDLNSALGLTGWPSGDGDSIRGPVIAELIANSGRLRSPGSPALGLAWTAFGRADFAFYEQSFYDWDIAAGLNLCAEAGLQIRLEHGVDRPHRLLVAMPCLFEDLERIVFG